MNKEELEKALRESEALVKDLQVSLEAKDSELTAAGEQIETLKNDLDQAQGLMDELNEENESLRSSTNGTANLVLKISDKNYRVLAPVVKVLGMDKPVRLSKETINQKINVTNSEGKEESQLLGEYLIALGSGSLVELNSK